MGNVLEGEVVRLEPLGAEHSEALYDAAQPLEIWRWICPPPGETPERWRAFFDEALRASATGEEVAFATVDVASGRAIGSTRFLALRPEDRGLEIGWTWITPSAWRTGANVEAKLLQLTHAFEALRCIRVEFKTHASNERSRAAILALGAHFEGIHRKHRIVPGVGVRDTAGYSVIDDDWPQVRALLRARLAAGAASQDA